MRCARASSPRWNASFSTGAGSRRRPRLGSRCSNSSRASTTRAVVIPRSGISPRMTASVVMRPIPTHTSLPPCSRPSRTSPPGGPQAGPSLTAAARDGRTFVRAGMEEWLRRGPNKRMAPNRRAKCRQTRYPDPKPATLHETGASPQVRQVEGRPDAEEQSISLITIHASKGLEWPVIIPVNMTGTPKSESGLMQDRRSGEFSVPILDIEPAGYDAIKAWSEAEHARERVRLWYVAATRARDLLVLPRHAAKLSDKSWARVVE